MVATEVGLGVRPAADVTFLVIASPAGAYFASGSTQVAIWLSEDYTRAAPGGTGAAKCGGNYAASLVAQQEAIANGCEQVLFLDAVERRWVEELGGMNLWFVLDNGTMVTPELTGTILEGVTRDTMKTLAAEHGHDVEERRVDIDEWRKGVDARRDHRGLCLRHGGGHHLGRHAALARRRGRDAGRDAGRRRAAHRARRPPARPTPRPARLDAPGSLTLTRMVRGSIHLTCGPNLPNTGT